MRRTRHFLSAKGKLYILCFCAALAPLSANGHEHTVPLIEVSAEASVKAQPDQATFYLRFSDMQLKSDLARKNVDEQISKFLRSLKEFEIKENSLDSSQTQISPRYEYRSNERQFLGYEFSRNIEFTLTRLDQFGSLMRDVTDSAPTQLNRVQFSLADPQQAQNQALEKAIQKSLRTAKAIAQGYSVELGPIYNVNYHTPGTAPVMRARTMSMELADSPAPEPSYQQKEIEFKSNISVSFTFE